MKAMVLAAGRGERLRPLTDTCPKPLLRAGQRALIDHVLVGLAAAGVCRAVINLAWLGPAIRAHCGDGSAYGLEIQYSDEADQRLETGGGIQRALPLLGSEPFVLVNADVFSDFPLDSLVARARNLPSGDRAHLVLIPNPAHHPEGDFALVDDERLALQGDRLTYSGLAVIHPDLFAASRPGKYPLAPLLVDAMSAGRVGGERYGGFWTDVGTPERLRQLRDHLGA